MIADPFAAIQAATRAHRAHHGCEAYTFEDGPALHQLAAKWQPKRILELGTALGYTACCLAGGYSSAQVDTIEADALHVDLARAQIKRAGLANRIVVHHGRFDSVLAGLKPSYDMAFFDGFAPEPEVIRTVRQLLVDGGVLICSNLQLTSSSVSRDLQKDFDAAQRWLRQPSIEHGTTQVFIKRGA